MAFIEPMHRNKPNITYLLLISFDEHSDKFAFAMIYRNETAQVVSSY